MAPAHDRGRGRLRRAAALLCVSALAPLLASCGGARVSLRYPSEGTGYAGLKPEAPPRIYLGEIEDLRAADQREGAGHFVGITFPADRSLDRPVEALYREALAQDLTETGLAELVPLPRQAVYSLTAEIFSFGCRLERPPMSFVVPVIGGMMAGMVLGKTGSDKVKTGAVLSIAALMAVPLPSRVRGEAEIRLTLRDAAGEIVWRQTCRGELEQREYLTATAREDKKLAERYLPRAVKRANACLLGQLRQHLSDLAGGSAPAGEG